MAHCDVILHSYFSLTNVIVVCESPLFEYKLVLHIPYELLKKSTRFYHNHLEFSEFKTQCKIIIRLQPSGLNCF